MKGLALFVRWKWDGISIVINNAGVSAMGFFMGIPLED
jgi:hypothetical protein